MSVSACVCASVLDFMCVFMCMLARVYVGAMWEEAYCKWGDQVELVHGKACMARGAFVRGCSVRG